MNRPSRLASSRAAGLAAALAVLSAAPGLEVAAIGQSPDGGTEAAALMAANDGFYAALNKLLAGDPSGMAGVWSHGNGVSDFGPFGKMLDGWPEVEHRFGEEAAKRMGGSVTCENAAAFVGDEMGVVTCIEAAGGLMIDGKSVTVRTRATNVFTREGGAWKMIHHHADATLAPVSRR
jgi:hypothetical protein